MSDRSSAAIEERVLVLAPTARDAALCRSILSQAGLECFVCPDMRGVCDEIEIGAGAAVLSEESLVGDNFRRLAETIREQPAWSDFPLLVLTREGADSEVALRTLEILGNVTLLERPVRVPALVSAVRTALRARRRQHQIRDHLEDSTRIAEALQEDARRKDEFLAMLAHELRNPLAPICNGLRLLTLQGAFTPQIDSVRQMMERQVGHLVRLVDDLLDVSRILRGKIELRSQTIDLATVMARAVETTLPLIELQGHDLRLSLGSRAIYVQGDPVRLAQVFANLLNNAAKYTERGGRIDVSAEADAGEAVVRVRDNGMGIAPEMLPRVFEIFSQAERSLDRSQGGLGLGLTLVQRLTEMHGGSVHAHSEGLGRGSEFTVRLPLAPTGEAPAPPAPPNRVRLPLRRILVVDDNADAANSLTQLLRLEGHEVLTAYDGSSAIEAAKAFRPHVALLDIGLPGLDGYEVARQLRRQNGLENLVLVAVTGYGQAQDRRHTREAGFDHHLVKPINPEDLAAFFVRSPPQAI